MAFDSKFWLTIPQKIKTALVTPNDTRVDFGESWRALENWANKTGLLSNLGGLLRVSPGIVAAGTYSFSPETKFFIQAESVVFTPDGAGNAVITFPRPFPNGPICVVCSMAVALPVSATLYSDSNTRTRATFPIHIHNVATGAPYVTITAIDYVAIGW